MNHFWGATLLIAGTTIGGVTLALPIAMSDVGLLGMLILYGVCWLVMYLSGLILAEVCAQHPPGTSFVSITEKSFGQIGRVAAWLSYGILLITLLMAYFSSLSSLIDFNNVFFDNRIVGNTLVALVTWTILFMGTEFIDAMNRLMMNILIFAIFFMLFFLMFKIKASPWLFHIPTINELGHLLPIIIAGFGFQVVLPSVRTYLNKQESSLKPAIFFGSVFPLIIYMLWTSGVLTGLTEEQIVNLNAYSDETVAIFVLLKTIVNKVVINIFIFSAVVSSMLGIALSLKDFFLDVFDGLSSGVISFITVLIPWALVSLHPAAFLEILRFSGFIVALLNILIPCMLLIKERSVNKTMRYAIGPSNPIVYMVMFFSILVIVAEVLF